MSNRFHNKFHRHNHHTRPTDRSGLYPDSAYDPIASPEAPFQGDFVVDGNITSLSSMSAEGDFYATNGTFHGNVVIEGDLSVLGDFTQLDTVVHTTSAVDIYNSGTGPALQVTQVQAEQPIAYFIDSNGGEIIFTGDGNVGLGTFSPNEKLTVIGNISGTGDLIIKGSEYLSGNNFVQQSLLVGGNILFADSNTTNVGIGTISPDEKLTVAGNIKSTGDLITQGNSYLSGSSNIQQTLRVDDNTLYVDSVANNVGVGTIYPNEKLTVVGNISSTGNLITQGNSYLSGNSYIQQDLNVNGNSTITGDLYVVGNFTAAGSATYINTQNLEVNDSLIYLAAANTANLLDIGFVGHFAQSPLGYQHTGLIRRSNQGNPGAWTLFSGLTTEPLTGVNIDWADTNIVLDTLSANIATPGGTSNDWNSVYSTVNANSAVVWNYQGSDLKALSANWQNTYGSVNLLSANWSSAYSTVNANSAIAWNYQGEDLKALSGDWQQAYTNLVSNSAAYLTSVNLAFLSVSANWNSVYNTVKSLSSSWSAGGGGGGGLATGDYLPLSGGTVNGPVVINDAIFAKSIVVTDPSLLVFNTIAVSANPVTYLSLSGNDVELNSTMNVTITSFQGGVKGALYTITNKSTNTIVISSTPVIIVRGSSTLSLQQNASCSLRSDSSGLVSIW